MKRFDVRAIAFVGVSVFAASCFMNVMLSGDSAGDQFFAPNIVRALGQALVLTPISAITTAGIAPSEAGAASGLSNMLRNLGGAVGTATLATIITKREQFHSNVIGQSITLYSEETRRRVAELDQLFSRRTEWSGTGRRAARGDRGDRQDRASAGADHGLQRRLRGRRRGAGRRRDRAPVHPQDHAGRRGGRRPLTRGALRTGASSRRRNP